MSETRIVTGWVYHLERGGGTAEGGRPAIVAIPQPPAPPGYEHTNEFRPAKCGEPCIGFDGGPGIGPTTWPYWILRESPRCQTCGQTMPGKA